MPYLADGFGFPEIVVVGRDAESVRRRQGDGVIAGVEDVVVEVLGEGDGHGEGVAAVVNDDLAQ